MGADHYRVYFKTSAGSYQYFDTADSSTSYTISTATGATTGDPLLVSSDVVYSQFRMKTAMGSGTIWRARDWVSSAIANGSWETLYFGVIEGSQAPSLWGDDPIGWKLAFDSKNSTYTPHTDMDCIWLLPADEPLLHMGYQDALGDVGGLATSRDWRYDLRPDLQQSAILLETGTTTEAGPIQYDGRMMIQPNTAALTILALCDGLVSDVTNVQFTVTLRYIPRYLYLDGGS